MQMPQAVNIDVLGDNADLADKPMRSRKRDEAG